jgi:hypothetical protein
VGREHDHVRGRDIVRTEKAVEEPTDGSWLVVGVEELGRASFGTARVRRRCSVVELEELAVDRLGRAAVRPELVLEVVRRDLELCVVDALVVVEEEPHWRVLLVAETEPQRVEPVVVQVLRLVDDQGVELRAEDVDRVRQLVGRTSRQYTCGGVSSPKSGSSTWAFHACATQKRWKVEYRTLGCLAVA